MRIFYLLFLKPKKKNELNACHLIDFLLFVLLYLCIEVKHLKMPLKINILSLARKCKNIILFSLSQNYISFLFDFEAKKFCVNKLCAIIILLSFFIFFFFFSSINLNVYCVLTK